MRVPKSGFDFAFKHYMRREIKSSMIDYNQSWFRSSLIDHKFDKRSRMEKFSIKIEKKKKILRGLKLC